MVTPQTLRGFRLYNQYRSSLHLCKAQLKRSIDALNEKETLFGPKECVLNNHCQAHRDNFIISLAGRLQLWAPDT